MEKRLTKEDIVNAKKEMSEESFFEAEAFFNLASMLGRSIKAALFQYLHPEYNPEVLQVEVSMRGEAENNQDQGKDTSHEPSPTKRAPKRKIHSNEEEIDDQMSQLDALYHPAIMELIGDSALVSMFRLALLQFNWGIKDTNPKQAISPEDKRKFAIAWVTAKRVFAVRHPDETLRILSLTDAIRGDTIYGERPIVFRPMDKTDEEMIVETCGLFDIDSGKPIDLGKINPLKKSDKVSIPLSKAFWRQGEAAALGINKETGKRQALHIPDVYTDPKPVGVSMVISDNENKPVEITGFDMRVEGAILELWQANGGKPFQLSAASLFRECAGIDSRAAVSPASVETTINSLDKLRYTKTTIYYAEQIEAFLASHDEKDQVSGFDYSLTAIDGPLVSADRIKKAYIGANGKVIDDTFMINRPPILAHYSLGFKQIMEVDKKYMRCLPKATPENMSFATYILTQINMFLKDKEENKIPAGKPYTRKLTFKKIAERSMYFGSSNYKDIPRQRKRNFQDKIFKFCQNLVAAGGLIKDVEQLYDGKVYSGVKITV